MQNKNDSKFPEIRGNFREKCKFVHGKCKMKKNEDFSTYR